MHEDQVTRTRRHKPRSKHTVRIPNLYGRSDQEADGQCLREHRLVMVRRLKECKTSWPALLTHEVGGGARRTKLLQMFLSLARLRSSQGPRLMARPNQRLLRVVKRINRFVNRENRRSKNALVVRRLIHSPPRKYKSRPKLSLQSRNNSLSRRTSQNLRPVIHLPSKTVVVGVGHHGRVSPRENRINSLNNLRTNEKLHRATRLRQQNVVVEVGPGRAQKRSRTVNSQRDKGTSLRRGRPELAGKQYQSPSTASPMLHLLEDPSGMQIHQQTKSQPMNCPRSKRPSFPAEEVSIQPTCSARYVVRHWRRHSRHSKMESQMRPIPADGPSSCARGKPWRRMGQNSRGDCLTSARSSTATLSWVCRSKRPSGR